MESEDVFSNPSPEGKGCREAAGEGYSSKISLPLTWPLSLQERNLPKFIFQFGKYSFS
jgi:hypothetical protein